MIPKLSLVTGTLNRQASFERLLRSIERATSTAWELVVSDASDVPYDTVLPDNVVVIPERPRIGCTKGYNKAFRCARGEWVIWLNDDCEVLPGYDRQAIHFMQTHPQIGLGALYYAEDGSRFHINSAWKIPYANFGIIRREFGDSIGWFDEQLTMYGNDNSLTFRVLGADRGIAAIPHARVLHHSVKDQHREDNQRSRDRDNMILQHKYLPMIQEYRAIYQRHKVADVEAWSHGVPIGVFV